MRLCGFSVAALSLDLGQMNIARELIDGGYNYDFRIRPPSIQALEQDPTFLPPKPVQQRVGTSLGKAEMESNQCHRRTQHFLQI